MTKLLTLDISTKATGYAIFDIKTQKLLDKGVLTPDSKGLAGFPNFKKLYTKCERMASAVMTLYFSVKPSKIVIEEINNSKSRVTAKALSMAHTLILGALIRQNFDNIEFIDSDGKTGWRKQLNLVLTEADKKLNAERRKFNKKLNKNNKLPIITKKHLAARYVNSSLKTLFDVDKNKFDNDIVDAIGIGLGYFKKYS